MRDPELPPETLDEAELESVNGGRITNPNAKPDPVMLAMVSKLNDTVSQIGAAMTSGKQASQQQLMQVMQQMNGEGKRHA